jgi:sugar phosphate isomerase/epimerase
MRIAGHTMATPECNALEAVEIFAAAGLDGIELVSDDASGVLPERLDNAARGQLRQAAADRGLAVACLTPYLWDINAADEALRRAQIEGAKRALELAADLGARIVRAYGGRPAGSTGDRIGAFERAAGALGEIGRTAGDLGLRVGVENHQGTLAISARATLDLVEAAGSPHVGIVYDQANLDGLGAEGWEEALPMQYDHIVHVHVKDFDRAGSGPAGGRRARIVGEGIVAWPAILASLAARGYDGFLSLEYERKWHPDQLPPAAEGLPRCASFVRQCLAGVGGVAPATTGTTSAAAPTATTVAAGAAV